LFSEGRCSAQSKFQAPKQSIVTIHTVAIVGDADVRGSSVQRIFQQFLDDRGRPVHYLASSDLFGNLVREYADAAHKLSG
jgi:hypothetical protein